MQHLLRFTLFFFVVVVYLSMIHEFNIYFFLFFLYFGYLKDFFLMFCSSFEFFFCCGQVAWNAVKLPSFRGTFSSCTQYKKRKTFNSLHCQQFSWILQFKFAVNSISVKERESLLIVTIMTHHAEKF